MQKWIGTEESGCSPHIAMKFRRAWAGPRTHINRTGGRKPQIAARAPRCGAKRCTGTRGGRRPRGTWGTRGPLVDGAQLSITWLPMTLTGGGVVSVSRAARSASAAQSALKGLLAARGRASPLPHPARVVAPALHGARADFPDQFDECQCVAYPVYTRIYLLFDFYPGIIDA